MVADVDPGPPARLQHVLFGQEIPVSFTVAWKKSADGTLSRAIQDEGLAALRRLVRECDALGARSRCAVATEVFRKAANGGDYLSRVREELGIEAKLVSQDDEAQLGFRTAVALRGCPEQEVLCWDSGGGSFQITSPDPEGGPLRSYLGALGSGNCTAILVEEVQGRAFAEHPSPNPVASEEAAALVARLRRELGEAPSWLRGGRVTAIGGPNSMFALAADIIGGGTYTEDDVRRALAATVGLSDAELATSYCRGEDRDPPSLCCPKLCLLLAVVEHCGIEEVSFQAAIGSCPGLLVSSERYVD